MDPKRVAHALQKDVCTPPVDALILQEADEDAPPHRGFLDIAQIEAATGLRSAHQSPASRWGPESHGFLGIILFVNPLWQVQDLTLLDLPGHCHRGAVIVDLLKEGLSLRLIGTHLSLSQPLRILQMRTIGQHLFRRRWRQSVLCGDLNEWRPWGGFALSPKVTLLAFKGPSRATFPTGRPIFPLDRILASHPAKVMHTEVLDSPTIRIASDHRPIRGTVMLSHDTYRV